MALLLKKAPGFVLPENCRQGFCLSLHFSSAVWHQSLPSAAGTEVQHIWRLIQWSAAHTVVVLRASWGAGVQARAWSLSRGRQTASSCVMSHCSSVLTTSCCARGAPAPWDVTLSLGRHKRKGRRKMWLSSQDLESTLSLKIIVLETEWKQ